MAELLLRTAIDVGALIRDRRRMLKLDQAELAEPIGVSRLWVNQVERGRAGAGLGLVLSTLYALGVTLTARQGITDELEKAFRASPAVFTPDVNTIVAAHRRKPGP